MTSSSRLNARRGGGVGNPAGSPKNITSGSCLDAREVVVVAAGEMDVKHHLQFVFEHEERWWCWESCQKPEKHHLRLAFGCEGGGGGGRDVKHHLWLAFEREGGGGGGNRDRRPKTQPPARIWTRGGW